MAIGFGLRNTWLGAWSIPLGLLSGASIFLASMFAEWLELWQSPRHQGHSGRWGFDPDDALYLMGPLAWLGWLSPILVGASVGATAMMIITGSACCGYAVSARHHPRGRPRSALATS